MISFNSTSTSSSDILTRLVHKNVSHGLNVPVTIVRFMSGYITTRNKTKSQMRITVTAEAFVILIFYQNPASHKPQHEPFIIYFTPDF